MSMPIVSKIKSFWYGDNSRVDWFLFYDFVNKQGENIGVMKVWAIYFYTTLINFIIIAYCLLYPTGIHRWVKEFILVMCVLDLLHMVLYAGKSYVFLKLVIGIIITFVLAHRRSKEWCS
jgi:hypothetical protein